MVDLESPLLETPRLQGEGNSVFLTVLDFPLLSVNGIRYNNAARFKEGVKT